MEAAWDYGEHDELSLEGDQFVAFRLGREEYGVRILDVQEIISYRGFTTLPNAPKWVKGVLNLRGTVIPVLDLRLRFGLEALPYDKFTVILIVVVQGRTMGLVVDAVSDVLTLPSGAIQPAPAMSSRIRHDYLLGMGRKGDGFVILLDTERVLSLEELDALDEVVN